MESLTSDPTRLHLIKSRILCRSLAQNYVHILTISNPHSTLEAQSKKVVVLTSRVHPGETNGSWMMKGFLDFITSSDPDANTLRKMVKIYKLVYDSIRMNSLFWELKKIIKLWEHLSTWRIKKISNFCFYS